MAGKNVELGTVGFNLQANDASLDASLAKLRKFGEAVNKASNDTSEGSKAIYTNMVRVEKAISSVFDRMSALTEQMSKAGNSAAQVQKLTSQYDALASSLIKVARAVEPHEMVRATVGMQAAAQQATRAIKEQEAATQRLSQQQNVLHTAQQRVANLTASMRIRGAQESDIARLNDLLGPFQAKLSGATLSTKELREAQRAFGASLGAVTREMRENIATAGQQERQQARLIAATRNVAYLNARALRLNLPNDLSSGNNAALNNFGAALTSGKQDQIVAAQRRLNDSMMATRLAMIGAEAPISKLSLTMHDLSRATVLALGPLSGVGARISVITSLLDSNSVSVAMFIGGMVAATASLYALTSASIKAAMQQEQFDASLITAAGSATLVAKEYAYLLDVSNKMGVSIQGLVKPYSDFAATARLAGFSTETQRKVFESLITTGTALRWNTEAYGRAFLAVTQMLSKGTVSSEELKRQLGEIIPNVIGLSAAAEKTSTGGLLSMMKKAELLSKDHLPKLAAVLDQTFSPAAAAGAQTASANIQRLSNATFEALKEFDRVTGVLDAFNRMVILTTNLVNYLSVNMETLVGVMAALAGAGAGLAVVTLLGYMPAAITAVTTAMAGLTAGTITLTTAINILTSTTVVGWIIKLAAAALGAAAAFWAFRNSVPAAEQEVQSLTGKIDDWVKTQEKVGITQKRVHGEMLAQAKEQMGAINKQIDTTQALIKAKEDAAKNVDNSQKGKFTGRSLLMGSADNLTNDPEVKKAKEKLAILMAERDKMASVLSRMGMLKVDNPDANAKEIDDKAVRKWEAWEEKVTDLIAKVKGQYAELEAYAKGGTEARQIEEAHTKALKLFDDMPKTGGNIKALSKTLRDAGYEGKTLVEQLQAVYLAEDKHKDKLKEIDDKIRDQKQSSEDLAKVWEKLAIRRMAVTGEVDGYGAEDYKNAKNLETQIVAITKLYTTLGVDQATINRLVKEYADEWKRVTGLEEHQKDIEKVTRELERLDLRLGDTEDRLMAKNRRQVEIVERAVQLEVLTREEGNELILKANDDLYRRMVLGGNEYYKALHDSMGNIEDTMVAAFEGAMLGSENVFKAGLKAMLVEINAFVIRIGIVRPAMTALFGSLYTGSTASGGGLLGGAIQAGIGALSGAITGGFGFGTVTPSFGEGSGWTHPLGGRATGGGMNPFASYLVGENGPEILRMGAQVGHVQPLGRETPSRTPESRKERPLIVNIYPPPGTNVDEFARSGRQMANDMYKGMRKSGALT